jgi:hypothetical protein
MFLDREIRNQLLQAADQFPVVVLTGARQAGKTTALQNLFPHHRYVSLDLPSLAEQAERDPETFLSTNPPPLIVDEVQYAPGLFRHIKAAVDRNRHNNGQYILTGSQHFILMKNISDSLAGRAAVFELENLSLPELCKAGIFCTKEQSLFRLLCRGQFPELWRNQNIDRNIFYTSYLITYLERDVRQILQVTSLRDFERFIRLLAARSGSILNKTDLAKDVGVSSKAINDWISVLQASGQIVLLEPWFTNFGKRLVRSPKVYFRDSGLLSFLLGIDETILDQSPFKGAIWETFLFAELRKTDIFRTGQGRIWYYRDQNAREVDFILEYKGTLSFVEAKWTEHPEERDAKIMNSVYSDLEKSSSPWKAGNRCIICRTAHPYHLADGTMAVPAEAVHSLWDIPVEGPYHP